ncbi:MAG TPA: M1 family metallopeptidase [Acidimicrobiales bacterium]|nr:M1 family metallopeptidase [Acidimicrobiales bacterium]
MTPLEDSGTIDRYGDAEEYRLPYATSPRRYELHLAPDLARATFSGSERIELEVHEQVERIVMNATDLEIGDAALARGWMSTADLETAASTLRVEADPGNERVAFSLPGPVGPGRYTLSCAFAGELNDKLCGFYRSTFVDESGTEHVIATTQFEETDARRAFPCYDEPDRKAVFAVTLDAPPEMLALSNSPETLVEELQGGGRRVHFADTIAMSTYLVAFVVGPLEITGPVDVDGIDLRVVHVPGKAHLTAPAFDAATHALRFFTDYFGLPYPGLKLDLVALPDFAAGAMENLGCVTFREAIVLADPEHTSRPEMERLAEVVEHEIAHMWFGDLVTMGWWNGIWLNEAFATFMQLCCQDDYRPEWESFVSFARSREVALGVDGLHTTRPIEYPVRHPDDAAAMFDVLTYEKGAGVLWMVEQYLGRERFRAGVRRYLDAHKYGNTETTDLWDAIEAEASDIPIRALMDSWIFQGGYPLVSAESALDDTGAEVVRLLQSPFSYLPPEAVGGDSAVGSHWLVPLLVSTIGGDEREVQRVLLGPSPEHVEVGGTAVVVNAGGSGFYRLRYDRALRSALLADLDGLAPLERFNLVADVWATTLAGISKTADYFELLPKLVSESDPHVWSVVIGALTLLHRVAPDADRPALQALVRALLAPHLAKVGWERVAGEEEQTPLLRSTLVSALGTVGDDPAVVHRAHELFVAEHAGDARLDPDLTPAILGVVAAHASRVEFDQILGRYRHPLDPMDQMRHLNSLARLTDAELASELYDLCLHEVRSQNAPYLLSAMLANWAIGPTTWRFVSSHFDELVARFPENSIPRMLEGVAGLAQLDETGEPRYAPAVRAFCEEHVVGPRQRLVRQHLERLDVNVRFAQRVRPELGSLVAEAGDGWSG